MTSAVSIGERRSCGNLYHEFPSTLMNCSGDERLFVLSYDDLPKLLPQLTASTQAISIDLGWTHPRKDHA